MTTTTIECVGALDHRPNYAEVDRHHVYPKYLCGLLGVPTLAVTVPLCAQCHDLVHHALHHLINTGTIDGHRLAAGSRWIVYEAWRWWQAELAPRS